MSRSQHRRGEGRFGLDNGMTWYVRIGDTRSGQVRAASVRPNIDVMVAQGMLDRSHKVNAADSVAGDISRVDTVTVATGRSANSSSFGSKKSNRKTEDLNHS